MHSTRSGSGGFRACCWSVGGSGTTVALYQFDGKVLVDVTNPSNVKASLDEAAHLAVCGRDRSAEVR
jgi:hypothetical protein